MSERFLARCLGICHGLFGQPDGSGFWRPYDYHRGQIAELMVYNGQLSKGDINLVADYLSTTYALPFAFDFTGTAVAGYTGLGDATPEAWRCVLVADGGNRADVGTGDDELHFTDRTARAIQR